MYKNTNKGSILALQSCKILSQIKSIKESERLLISFISTIQGRLR